MNSIKRIICITIAMVFLLSLPVSAKEMKGSYDQLSVSISAGISPRAFLTATDVKKWSNNNMVRLIADVVTNDGIDKVIDVKNAKVNSWDGSVDPDSIKIGACQLWSNNTATITVTYKRNKNIESDVVVFYPHGK